MFLQQPRVAFAPGLMAETIELGNQLDLVFPARFQDHPCSQQEDEKPASIIDAAVGITPILQNLSEHHSDLRGAKLQQFRRNVARTSRTRA
jgi:hypothetical protein